MLRLAAIVTAFLLIVAAQPRPSRRRPGCQGAAHRRRRRPVAISRLDPAACARDARGAGARSTLRAALVPNANGVATATLRFPKAGTLAIRPAPAAR